jgi:HlyD family secretion protein
MIPAPLRGRTAVIIAGLALAAVLLVWFLRPGNTQAATAFHEVRRGNFAVSVVEGGNLSAVSEVSVRNEVEGVARIIFIVPEGSYVMEGDLLVELDSAQAQDQVNQQQIAFERARFGVIQAEQTLEIQRSTTNSDLRAAALKLKFAELDLRKFDEGQRIVDLVDASNKLVTAQAQLAVNLETYLNTRRLAAKGYETKLREDGDRLTVLNNTNSLIVASNNLWMLRTFDHPKQREKFESDVSEAKSELDRVLAQSIRRIAQYEADLLTQSNTLVLNSRKLERDKKNLDACRVYAPQDGLVVYASGENRWSSESLIEEGATVRNRQEIIKLPDTSRMKVTVKVHESHVNMIRPGLPAFVTLDSMPDERFAGIVEKVGLLPDTQSRWGNPNLKVYNTDIHITDKLPDVKPGVSAKAEIIITNIESALSVPIQAVTTLKGKQVVYLASSANGGQGDSRAVEVGLYNTKYIQIISGVKEGDRVLLSPPFDTQSKDLTGEILAPDEKARIKFTNTLPSGGSTRINRDDMLKRYDRDKDGKLNDQEKAAMERAFGDRISQPNGPGNNNPGNGNRSQEGRPGGAGNRPGGNAPNDAPSEGPRNGGNRSNRNSGGAGSGSAPRERPPSP